MSNQVIMAFDEDTGENSIMSNAFNTLNFDDMFADPQISDDDENAEEVTADDDENNPTDGEDSTEESGEGGEDVGEEDKYELEIDGEKVTVDIDELKLGYLRLKDYTKKTQSLKQEIEKSPVVQKLQAEKDELAETAEVANSVFYELGTDFGTAAAEILRSFSTDERSGQIDADLVIQGLDNFLEAASLIHPDIAKRFYGDSADQYVQLNRQKVSQRKDLLARGSSITAAERKAQQASAGTQEEAWAGTVTSSVQEAVAELSRETQIEVANDVFEFVSENKITDINIIKGIARTFASKAKVTATAPVVKKTVPKKTPVNKPGSPNTSTKKPVSMRDDILNMLRS